MSGNISSAATQKRAPEVCPHCLKVLKRWSVKSHIAKGYCREANSYNPVYRRQNALIDSSIRKIDVADKSTQSSETMPNKNAHAEQLYTVKEVVVDEEDQDLLQGEEENERNVAVYVRRLYIYNY